MSAMLPTYHKVTCLIQHLDNWTNSPINQLFVCHVYTNCCECVTVSCNVALVWENKTSEPEHSLEPMVTEFIVACVIGSQCHKGYLWHGWMIKYRIDMSFVFNISHGQQFADDTFQCFFVRDVIIIKLNKGLFLKDLLEISPILTVAGLIAWYRTGDEFLLGLKS